MTTSDKKPRRAAKTAKTAGSTKTPSGAKTAAGAKASGIANAPGVANTPGIAQADNGGGAAGRAHSAGNAPFFSARTADGVRGDGTRPIKAISISVTSRHHEDRQASIALAAYFRSELRGFAPGHEVEDWLAAEEEVDQRLLGEGRAS